MKLKTILSSVVLSLIGLSAYADDTDISTLENAIYIESGATVTIDANGDAIIPIMMKNTVGVTGYQFNVVLPDGISKDNVTFKKSTARKTDEVSYSGAYQTDGSYKAVAYTSDDLEFSGNDGEIVTMTIANATAGNYAFTIASGSVTSHGTSYKVGTDIVSSVTINEPEESPRAEQLNYLPEGYSVEIIPQTIARGETTLKAYIKAATGIKSMSFDVELPEGMYFVDEAEWDKANVSYTYNSAAFTGTPGTQTATIGDGDFPTKMSFTVTGTYTNKSKKYITATNDLVELVEFGPLYIATEEDVTENDWESNGTTLPADGENIIKVKNISLTDVNGTAMTGEYYATFMYGASKNTDPILYGDYTSSDAQAVLNNSITENTTSVDLTAATIAAKPDVVNPNTLVYAATNVDGDNVIVNKTCANLVLTDMKSFNAPAKFTATNASYSRTMSNNWGTICLPYAVESNTSVAYYKITGIDNDVLTIEKYETLPAGTPALVKKLSGSEIAPQASNVAVKGTLGNVTGDVTVIGSYTNDTKVEDANAYYIKSNNFYLCNEYFFVDAFRAYFTTAAGAKDAVLTIGDDEVTAINALTGHSNVTIVGVYDASGAARSELGNGLNIVKLSNGKTQKILVK